MASATKNFESFEMFIFFKGLKNRSNENNTDCRKPLGIASQCNKSRFTRLSGTTAGVLWVSVTVFFHCQNIEYCSKLPIITRAKKPCKACVLGFENEEHFFGCVGLTNSSLSTEDLNNIKYDDLLSENAGKIIQVSRSVEIYWKRYKALLEDSGPVQD